MHHLHEGPGYSVQLNNENTSVGCLNGNLGDQFQGSCFKATQ